jgi:hypothetical protein
MRSKKQKLMQSTSLAVASGLQYILMRDFSESLSFLIIKHNYCKHGLKLTSLDMSGKEKVVDSIISDFKAIKPIGGVSVLQLKKKLLLAIK